MRWLDRTWLTGLELARGAAAFEDRFVGSARCDCIADHLDADAAVAERTIESASTFVTRSGA